MTKPRNRLHGTRWPLDLTARRDMAETDIDFVGTMRVIYLQANGYDPVPWQKERVPLLRIQAKAVEVLKQMGAAT